MAPATAASPAAIGLPGAAVDPLQPLAEIDRAIAVWTANLERDEGDYIAATYLAELYLSRSRLSADPGDLARALDASTIALGAYPGLVAARLLEAQVRLARHDFSEAEASATAILEAHPGLAHALATLGDAQLELGRYDAARASYEALAAVAPEPAVTARIARLAAITGQLDEARRLAAHAASEAGARADTRPTDVAWYQTLGGSLAFQAGDLAAADVAYQAALDAWPASAAALAGLGRTRAAQGDVDAAIGLYERSVALVPAPDALAALGDLLAAAGRADDAAAAHAQVLAIAQLANAAGLHDRHLALFLANHELDAARAVAVAATDLERRSDVYAFDAYAWALFAEGRYDEADVAMRAARAQGTEDAAIDYHAGMIAMALGRDEEARVLLRAALHRNPGFDVLQADRAAAALAELGAGR
jgi:tetratricopeptide (TPR) repeat protein